MGARGPAKEPTVLKVLKGNPGKKRINENEFKPDDGLAECPEWLNAEAKKVWNDLAPKLKYLTTEVDHYNFMSICLAIAELKKAQKILDKKGLTYTLSTKSGEEMPYQRPEVSIVKKNIDIISKIGAKFGMSPSDRAGLAIDKPHEEESKMAKLLKGG